MASTKSERLWVLVADAGTGDIYLSETPEPSLQPIPNGHFEDPHKASRDIAADRPGRVHDRMGTQRHAMQPHTDPHEHARQAFAHQLGQAVNSAAARGDFDRLVLVAPPKMMGELRAELSDEAEKRLVSTIAKDLVGERLPELEKRLATALSS